MVTVHLGVQSGGVNDSQPMSLWVSLGSPVLVWAAPCLGSRVGTCPPAHFSFLCSAFPTVINSEMLTLHFLASCPVDPNFQECLALHARLTLIPFHLPILPARAGSWQRPWFRILHSVRVSEGYHVSQASLMQRSKSAFMLLVDILPEINRK